MCRSLIRVSIYTHQRSVRPWNRPSQRRLSIVWKAKLKFLFKSWCLWLRSSTLLTTGSSSIANSGSRSSATWSTRDTNKICGWSDGCSSSPEETEYSCQSAEDSCDWGDSKEAACLCISGDFTGLNGRGQREDWSKLLAGKKVMVS